MFVELHILQNFAPSNLNRDDTNAPKTCEFGGYRRARISSQAIKRAMRGTFAKGDLIAPEHLAARTKRLSTQLIERFTMAGKDTEAAERVVEAAIQGLGLKFQAANTKDEEKKTEYLLFLGHQEISALVDVCLEHWDTLLEVVPAESSGAGRNTKKAAKKAVPNELQKVLQDVLDGGKAADVALFGRMLADLPQRNIDAASQVAHAISTNKVSMEFDFFTAVDDLLPKGELGAGMMDTVGFNSSCFYRYANVDMNLLTNNLSGDGELVAKTVEAFVRSAVAAIPTGKQNSMAAQNPPSFVMAVVREDGLWSLANAFVKPITHGHDDIPTDNLITRSGQALASYWSRMAEMYGTDGIAGAWFISLDGGDDDGCNDNDLSGLTGHDVKRVTNLQKLVNNVVNLTIGSSVDKAGASA